MSKRGPGFRRVVKYIKTKDNVFFDRNPKLVKKLTVIMNELNGYNSTPERSNDPEMDDDNDDEELTDDISEDNMREEPESTESLNSQNKIDRDMHMDVSAPPTVHSKSGNRSSESVKDFAERCRYIPMRLTEDERRLLSVLENALEVCEYTDTVDVTYSHTGKSKQSRIIASLVDVLSIACGLLVSEEEFSYQTSKIPLYIFQLLWTESTILLH
jgi:Protein of unknown function (DUF2009)